MRRYVSAGLVALSFLIAGCRPPAPDVSAYDESMYDASYDEVWDATVRAFADYNMPIDNIEKDSGIIASDWVGAETSWMDCGSAGLGSHTDRQFRVNTLIRRGSDGTNVRVNTLFQTREVPMGGGYGTWKQCSGTGELEQILHAQIEQYIADHRAEAAGTDD